MGLIADSLGHLLTESDIQAVEQDPFYQRATEEQKKQIRAEIETRGMVTAGLFSFIEDLVTG